MQITFTVSDYNGTNVSCFGSKDGSVTVHITGSIPPYKYLWSNGATTATITGCSADYYGVTVTDSTGAMAEEGINLTSPAILKPILVAYVYNNGYNISLFNASNGSITTTVDGGVSPFTYEWEDGPATQNRAMLGGGFYNVTVTDANNCLASAQTTLSEPERDDWTMSGNANSNPATQFIGTTDAKDFVVKTNGAERMRIKSDGVITMPTSTHFDKLLVHRISSPDSLIYIGDSTIIVQGNQNRFWGNPFGTIFRGIAMGAASHSYGQFSSVIGHFSTAGVVGGAVGANADESVVIGNRLNTGANAIGSIVIGSGITGGASMSYNLPHSIAMGINSSIPTVVVTQANGAGTTGNVGIGTGTTIPLNKTDINGAVAIGTYAGVNIAPTNGLIVSGKTGIGTAAPSATLQVNYVNSTNDGSVVFVGADPPTYLSTLPISGAGNRLMWLPDYGAFRAGVVTGNQWDQLQIGHLSFAVGENTSAYGTRSFVMDYGSSASDENSFAGGNGSNATGNNSFAFGNGSSATFLTDCALGFQTIAQGGLSFAANDRSHAYGVSSFATGGLTTASGGYSSAFGLSTISGGIGASAFGSGTTASGDAAVSMGSGSTASGTNSMAVGENSGAYSRAEFTLGRFNEITTGDPVNWDLDDPIFQIGISEPFMPSHNAMTVFKNGNVCIGTITASSGIFTVQNPNVGNIGTFDPTNGWIVSSDARLKTNIKPLESSLDKILRLQGISYNWKKDNSAKSVVGFIAQDVEKVFPEIVVIDKQGNYLMAPQNLTAPIIEAIKEQQQQLKSKDESIQNLSDKVQDIQKRMDQIEEDNKNLNDKINTCCANSGNSNQSYELNNVERTQSNKHDVSFFENKLIEAVPNPFSSLTTVKYHLTSTANSAIVTFQNGDGKILSSKIIIEKNDGQLTFECSDCPSGIYFCTLWIDGRKCDTRLLVLNK